MVRQHHWLNEHESEQTPGDGKGQVNTGAVIMGSQRAGHDLATEQQILQMRGESVRVCSVITFFKQFLSVHQKTKGLYFIITLFNKIH